MPKDINVDKLIRDLFTEIVETCPKCQTKVKGVPGVESHIEHGKLVTKGSLWCKECEKFFEFSINYKQ